MRTFPILFVVAFLIYNIPDKSAGVDEVQKKALQQIEGEWKMVSGTADGRPLPESMAKQMERIFKGDELTVTRSGETFFKAKVTVDRSKSPMTIDYEMTEGVTKGQRQLGIYQIEGNTFKSSFASPGAARPSDFSTKEGDGRTVTVWEREK